jgi:hypothetical protein
MDDAPTRKLKATVGTTSSVHSPPISRTLTKEVFPDAYELIVSTKGLSNGPNHVSISGIPEVPNALTHL